MNMPEKPVRAEANKHEGAKRPDKGALKKKEGKKKSGDAGSFGGLFEKVKPGSGTSKEEPKQVAKANLRPSGEKRVRKAPRKGAKKVKGSGRPKVELSPEEEAKREGLSASKKRKLEKEDGWGKRKKTLHTMNQIYSRLINPHGEGRDAQELVRDLIGKVQEETMVVGGMEKFGCSQDGSRVLQACLKWGSAKERRRITDLLVEHIRAMAADRYGHKTVLKLFTYGIKFATSRVPTEEERRSRKEALAKLLKPFCSDRKKLAQLFFQKFGCAVVNHVFHMEALSRAQKWCLLNTVAVPPAYALQPPPGFSEAEPLVKAVANPQASEAQAKELLRHLRDVCDRCVDKELLCFDVVHEFFAALCKSSPSTPEGKGAEEAEKAAAAEDEEMNSLAEQVAEGAHHLLASKPGAEAFNRLVGYFPAKQKKAFCKTLKGKFMALATNSVDYLVLMRLQQVTDDTVMIGSTMLGELLQAEAIRELAFDKYGKKVLLWLLAPGSTRFFSPYELAQTGLPAPCSMKAEKTRRAELLKAALPKLRKALLEDEAGKATASSSSSKGGAEPVGSDNAPLLLRCAADKNARDLLNAVVDVGGDQGDHAVGLAFVEAAASAWASGKEELVGLLDSGTTVATVLGLLKGAGGTAIAPKLWAECVKPQLSRLVVSHWAFVVLELCKRSDTQQQALSALQGEKERLRKAAKAGAASGQSVKGVAALLDILQGGSGAASSPRLGAVSSPRTGAASSPRAGAVSSPRNAAPSSPSRAAQAVAGAKKLLGKKRRLSE